jgi:hypothetical protein
MDGWMDGWTDRQTLKGFVAMIQVSERNEDG